MKKIFIILAAIFLMCNLVNADDILSTTPILWLNALDIKANNGASISTWNDSSGYNNNAVTVAPGVLQNETFFLNKPCVYFDGNNYYLDLVNLTAVNSTIMITFKPLAAGGSLYSTSVGSAFDGLIPSSSGTRRFYIGGTDQDTINPTDIVTNNFYYILAEYNGINSNLSINGTNIVNAASSIITKYFDLGVNAAVPSYSISCISEVLIWNKTLTNAERNTAYTHSRITWFGETTTTTTSTTTTSTTTTSTTTTSTTIPSTTTTSTTIPSTTTTSTTIPSTTTTSTTSTIIPGVNNIPNIEVSPLKNMLVGFISIMYAVLIVIIPVTIAIIILLIIEKAGNIVDKIFESTDKKLK